MHTSARNEIDHQATCGSLPQFLAERKRNRCQLGEGYGAALKRWPVTLRPSPALVPARSTFRGSIEHGRRGCRATSTWRRVARARRRAASLHAWAAGVETSRLSRSVRRSALDRLRRGENFSRTVCQGISAKRATHPPLVPRFYLLRSKVRELLLFLSWFLGSSKRYPCRR